MDDELFKQKVQTEFKKIRYHAEYKVYKQELDDLEKQVTENEKTVQELKEKDKDLYEEASIQRKKLQDATKIIEKYKNDSSININTDEENKQLSNAYRKRREAEKWFDDFSKSNRVNEINQAKKLQQSLKKRLNSIKKIYDKFYLDHQELEPVLDVDTNLRKIVMLEKQNDYNNKEYLELKQLFFDEQDIIQSIITVTNNLIDRSEKQFEEKQNIYNEAKKEYEEEKERLYYLEVNKISSDGQGYFSIREENVDNTALKEKKEILEKHQFNLIDSMREVKVWLELYRISSSLIREHNFKEVTIKEDKKEEKQILKQKEEEIEILDDYIEEEPISKTEEVEPDEEIEEENPIIDEISRIVELTNKYILLLHKDYNDFMTFDKDKQKALSIDYWYIRENIDKVEEEFNKLKKEKEKTNDKKILISILPKIIIDKEIQREKDNNEEVISKDKFINAIKNTITKNMNYLKDTSYIEEIEREIENVKLNEIIKTRITKKEKRVNLYNKANITRESKNKYIAQKLITARDNILKAYKKGIDSLHIDLSNDKSEELNKTTLEINDVYEQISSSKITPEIGIYIIDEMKMINDSNVKNFLNINDSKLKELDIDKTIIQDTINKIYQDENYFVELAHIMLGIINNVDKLKYLTIKELLGIMQLKDELYNEFGIKIINSLLYIRAIKNIEKRNKISNSEG